MTTEPKRKPGRPPTANPGGNIRVYLPADVIAWLRGLDEPYSPVVVDAVRREMKRRKRGQG